MDVDDEIEEISVKDPLSDNIKVFKCLNPDCRIKENLHKASGRTKNFYGVQGYRKKTRVCDNCEIKANIEMKDIVDSIRSGDFFHTLGGDMYRKPIILMDSDSDASEGSNEKSDIEYELDPAEFHLQKSLDVEEMDVSDNSIEVNNSQDMLRDVIAEICEELGLKSQIDKSTETIKKKLHNAEMECDNFIKEFRVMEKTLDKLRDDFYEGFKQDSTWLPPLDIEPDVSSFFEQTQEKFQSTSVSIYQIPKQTGISVEVIAEKCVTLNPKDLPPIADEMVYPKVKVGDRVFTYKHNLLSKWAEASILEIERVKSRLHYKVSLNKKSYSSRTVTGKNLAYYELSKYQIPVGTRIIAKFRDDCQLTVDDGSYFVGVIAEMPLITNKYRYLVFFDDGYAQYIQHEDIRVVLRKTAYVWELITSDCKEFIKNYLKEYPERPMVRLKPKTHILTELEGEWIRAKVVETDGSLVKMFFPPDKSRASKFEWIYRGSTRFSLLFNKKLTEQSIAESKNQTIRRRTFNKAQAVVEYLDLNNSSKSDAVEEPVEKRAVAKKSTSGRPGTPPLEVQEQMFQESRGVTHSRPIKVYLPKFTPHQCGPSCNPRVDVPKNISPLLKPILRYWRRQLTKEKKRTLGRHVVSYVAPCGRRLRSIEEVFRYLRITQSDLEIDFFSFDSPTDPTNEWEPIKKLHYNSDITNGLEAMPISCINSLNTSVPVPLTYCPVRKPIKNVNLNTDPDFLVCCSCTDDCQDPSRCECLQLSVEALNNIYKTDRTSVGYNYRRLEEQIPSGVFECNSRCSCDKTCLNRVVQHPLKQKLQLFKTARRGWGVRTLHDIPQGTFICVYVGKVLNESTANQEGKIIGGDDYYAELDFIEIVESIKEGYESDVEDIEAEEDNNINITGIKSVINDSFEDLDFRPDPVEEWRTYSSDNRGPSARIKARSHRKSSHDSGSSSPKVVSIVEIKEEDKKVLTRKKQTFEPSIKDFKPPPTMQKSARDIFGDDETVYIMDAKVSGNVGRYLNHSCQPNCFVQNVFVDTHDLRFPWVAFFSGMRIRAGSELTWDYNYEIGSVHGKIKYCYCMTRKCRGRLL